MSEPREAERRRRGAAGLPVRLADGEYWLLARPVFGSRLEFTATPSSDRELDLLFEKILRKEDLHYTDIWSVARKLLLANYELSDDEASFLISTGSSSEDSELVKNVLELLFGSNSRSRTYSRWVRGSLIANGLAGVELSAEDAANVLAILVATHRTIPLSQFAEECRLRDEHIQLEGLL